MRIWTIQSEGAWKALKRHGKIRALRKHQSDMWTGAYEWMQGQVEERVRKPPADNLVPLWGWYQWCDKSRRPDLRFIRHHWGPPGRYVLLELELPEREVLLSDHDAWHMVLSDHYLPLDQADSDQFEERIAKLKHERGNPLPEPYQSRKLKSWERIFDLEALNSEYWGAMDKKSIQACFWEVAIENVKSGKPFTALPQPKQSI